VLSDIHGMLPAFEAVLAEADLARAERIVLAGDLAAGLPARAIAGSAYPDVEAWVDDFVRWPPSQLEALAVFGPRDGRPG
jgi:predicted phosphodiesterase